MIIVINFCVVWINVKLNKWNVQFYNVLQLKDVYDFLNLLMQFFVFVFGFIIFVVYGCYLCQMFGFCWCQWFIDCFFGQWFGDCVFYWIECDCFVDNFDQWIIDDFQLFVIMMFVLLFDLLLMVVMFVLFIMILWLFVGVLMFMFGVMLIVIFGYMVWVVVLYVVIGLLIIQKVGYLFVLINYQQQCVEVDFCFGLICVCENVEQIVFYDGEKIEVGNVQSFFMCICDNWWCVMKYMKWFMFVLSFYGQIVIIFLFVVVVLCYFVGVFLFGVLMQILFVFGIVSDLFLWFINSYLIFVEWCVIVNCLCEFKCVMGMLYLKESLLFVIEYGGINLYYIDVVKLFMLLFKFVLLNGNVFVNIGDVMIEFGLCWFVVGKFGFGKSMFMCVFVGLWLFGDGVIDVLVGVWMMFVL